MARKERDFITLRFRKQLDDDLKEAVKSLEDGVLSNLVRDGLRVMLGIRTTKKIHVTESVLSIPYSSAQEIAPAEVEPQSKQEPTLQQMKKAPANNAGTTWRPSGR